MQNIFKQSNKIFALRANLHYFKGEEPVFAQTGERRQYLRYK